MKADIWESPAVAARVYTKPLKPRRHGPKLKRVDEEWTPSQVPDWDDSDWHNARPEMSADPNADVVTEEQLALYFDAVEASVAGFYRVGGNVFVVEGWDMKKCRSKVSSAVLTWVLRLLTITLFAQPCWYHLQYLWISDTLHVVCTCPLGIENRSCVHGELFKKFEMESRFDKELLRRSPSDEGMHFINHVTAKAHRLTVLYRLGGYVIHPPTNAQ